MPGDQRNHLAHPGLTNTDLQATSVETSGGFPQLRAATDPGHGAAFISEMAVLLAYLPMAVGLLQGRRICERLDIPLEWFEQTVMDLYPSHIQSLLERVADADPLAHNVEASIDIWGEGAAEYAAYLRELGLDAGMYEALHQLFTAASEGGHGDADWTCVVDHAANSSR